MHVFQSPRIGLPAIDVAWEADAVVDGCDEGKRRDALFAARLIGQVGEFGKVISNGAEPEVLVAARAAGPFPLGFSWINSLVPAWYSIGGSM